MTPTIIPQQATLPLPQASAARARWERESQESASATLELLEKTRLVLDTIADGVTDTLREELARQRASFEQAMQEILQERERITQRDVSKRRARRSDNAPEPWIEQLRTRAAGLFVTNPTASAVWHTAADQQALANILRLIDAAPEPRNNADTAYDDAVTFLRNLNASYTNSPQALLLRDQLRTITNSEAHEQLHYIIQRHEPCDPDRERG
jgi:hypothetical protein